jgi:hypothetical protein
MKIFIGADHYGADFPELERLRKISEEKGFTSFRNWINLMEEFGDYPLPYKWVVLRGGYTGICIAHSAEFLLGNNIDSVLIDLPNCRYDEKDLVNNTDSLNKRQEDVILGLSEIYRKDTRLSFILELKR